MKTKTILLGSILACLIPASAFATTYWLVVPDTKSTFQLGTTRIRVGWYQYTPDAPFAWDILVMRNGQTGVGISSQHVQVQDDDSGKPGVWEATRFLKGPGIVRIDSDPNLRPSTVSLEIESGGNTAWKLPVIQSSDRFDAGTTAYLQNLERSAQGLSNLQIANFSGDGPTSCRIQLIRPQGSNLGAPVPVTVKALTTAVSDALTTRAATGAGFKAQVTCDQRFFVLSTFVPATDRLKTRLSYAFDQLPTALVKDAKAGLARSGPFIQPSPGKPVFDLPLPLVRNVLYRKAIVDFDLSVQSFPTTLFIGVFGLYRKEANGPDVRAGRRLYLGSFLRGDPRKFAVDLGANQNEVLAKKSTGVKESTNYHVHIEYDGPNASFVCTIKPAGGGSALDFSGGVFNLDLADRGQPVHVQFSLPGVADNAYFPAYGWTFSNLNVQMFR